MMSNNSEKHVATSPERGTFMMRSVIERLEQNPDNKTDQEILEWHQSTNAHMLHRLKDPEWQKNNLEYDLRTCEWICDKVSKSDIYAQNLYAALCNNDFLPMQVFPILASKAWSCSWRYAGGIIADMRQKGDYIDWYCSGICIDDGSKSMIPEGTVTDEIAHDLKKLGWIVLHGE
jgi:hypothetical protein